MESACFSRLWNDRPPLTMSAEGTCVVLSNRVTYHIIIMTRRRILYISRGQPAVTFQRNPIIARRRVTQFTPKRRAIWRILYLLSLVLVVLGQGRYICSYTAWIETNAIVLQSMGVGYAVHHVRPISKAISRWLFFFFDASSISPVGCSADWGLEELRRLVSNLGVTNDDPFHGHSQSGRKSLARLGVPRYYTKH